MKLLHYEIVILYIYHLEASISITYRKYELIVVILSHKLVYILQIGLNVAKKNVKFHELLMLATSIRPLSISCIVSHVNWDQDFVSIIQNMNFHREVTCQFTVSQLDKITQYVLRRCNAGLNFNLIVLG